MDFLNSQQIYTQIIDFSLHFCTQIIDTNLDNIISMNQSKNKITQSLNKNLFISQQ